MIKYFSFNSYFANTEEPTLQYIHCNNNLVKTAASNDTSSGILKHFRENYTIRENCAYVLFIAMGSVEFWGPNNNADAFTEYDLRNTYSRFETEAHIYVEHRNKDKSICLGKPVVAKYNQKMHRIELILEFDYEQAKKNTDVDAINAIKDIKEGKLVEVSMGTHVDYDVCSICGHKAKTVKDHCTHIKYELRDNQYYNDGRRIYMINPDPHFFDISVVKRGADRTARGLLKVASDDSIDDNNYLEKLATMHEVRNDLEKKAKILKKIKAVALGKIETDEDKKIKLYMDKVINESIKNYTKDNNIIADKLSKIAKDNSDNNTSIRITIISRGANRALPNKGKHIDSIIKEMDTIVKDLDERTGRKSKVMDLDSIFNSFKKEAKEHTLEEILNDPNVRTIYSKVENKDGDIIDVAATIEAAGLKGTGKSKEKLINSLSLMSSLLGSSNALTDVVSKPILSAIIAKHISKDIFKEKEPSLTPHFTGGDSDWNPSKLDKQHPFFKASSMLEDIINNKDYLVEALSGVYI
jgi:hypothetical protein